MKNLWLNRALIVGPYYTLCTTEAIYRSEMWRLGIDKPPQFVSEGAQGTTHFFIRKGKSCAVVCIDQWQKHSPIEVCGLLVHEAVHVWQEWRDSANEKHPSSELEAYSIPTISQALMAEFERQTRRARRR